MTVTRETLELAALACGIQWYGAFEDSDGTAALDIAHDDVVFWRPYIDNDDNAAMCDVLGIEVAYSFHGEPNEMIVARGRDMKRFAPITKYGFVSEHNNDRGAARRYATTMVAAEIGRRMKEPNNAE